MEWHPQPQSSLDKISADEEDGYSIGQRIRMCTDRLLSFGHLKYHSVVPTSTEMWPFLRIGCLALALDLIMVITTAQHDGPHSHHQIYILTPFRITTSIMALSSIFGSKNNKTKAIITTGSHFEAPTTMPHVAIDFPHDEPGRVEERSDRAMRIQPRSWTEHALP